MQISKISPNLTFGGSIQRTDKGHEYEKTNVAKGWLTGFSVAGALLDFAVEKGTIGEKLVHGALGVAIAFGLGALIDHWANKQRGRDADSFAETKKVPEKTHRGVSICTKIGLIIGSISTLIGYGFLLSKKEAVSTARKFAPLILLPVSVLTTLVYGLLYDVGVNKFRTQLSQSIRSNNKPNS